MRIDVHAHIVPPGLPDLAGITGDSRWPALVVDGVLGRILADGRLYREVDDRYWAVDRRAADLAVAGIDIQVLSPLPVLLPYWAPAREAAMWCRAVNEAMAATVATGGSRFVGLGILPTQSTEAALEELARVKALGLVGVELGTALDGERHLGAPEADGLLTALAAEDVPVLVHPVRRGALGAVTGLIEAGAAAPVDTTRSLLARLWPPSEAPLPRACVVHGGGTIPWAWPRLCELVDRPATPLPPWFHVDTAAVDRHQLDYLLAVVGADRVMLGTDCPAAPAAGLDRQLAVLAALGPAGDAIAGLNARRFLGLRAEVS